MSFDLYELIEAMERVIPRTVEEGVRDALTGLGDGKRRAIQISISATPAGNIYMAVVCNDGAIFKDGIGGQWVRLPDIPQDEVAK